MHPTVCTVLHSAAANMAESSHIFRAEQGGAERQLV